MRRSILFSMLTVCLAACESGAGKITFGDTGVVSGRAYVDRNGDGQMTSADGPAVGIAAALVLQASGDTVARATTRQDGVFEMANVPAGRYRLVAHRGTAGDTIDVLQIDSALITLVAGDTVQRLIRAGYPRVTLAAARQLPSGRRVTVEGIALNAFSTFGDATVHISDATGFGRAIRVANSPVQAGDSVALTGTTGVSNGQFVLADALARVVVGASGLPAIEQVTTQRAANADGGRLRDGQVRIAGALIQDTGRVGNERVLGVNDGSGRLEVVFDASVTFDAGPWVPGGTFTGAGLLVPHATNDTWQLKPRERNEAVVSFQSTPISQARALPEGQQVVVQGIALNNWGAFGDSTVHVRDATGAIRGVRVIGTAAAGDSVRLIGTTGRRDGQPVITAATVTRVLAAVGLSAPDSISTVRAGHADNGVRDANQVRVAGLITGREVLAGGDVMLTVNDGSGGLQVILDKDVSFGAGTYLPGAQLNAAGVLVPTGTGAWQLKPRNAAEAVASFPSVTVQQARALDVGRVVFITGLALNGYVTFGDQTVHVQDATGAMRVVQLPTAPIFMGDSIRILGTVSVRNGQPVLTGTSASVLLAGVGLAAPDSVTTQTASNAAGGARDAGQVAISGRIMSATTESGTGDRLLTIQDDSDAGIIVRLDFDVGFPAGAFVVGDVVRVRGVLVPDASGTKWQLKPRNLSEIVVVEPA